MDEISHPIQTIKQEKKKSNISWKVKEKKLDNMLTLFKSGTHTNLEDELKKVHVWIEYWTR